MTYKTDSTYATPEYMNAPEISWTLSSTPVSAAPYTITCDTVADIPSAKIDTASLTNQINSALKKEIKRLDDNIKNNKTNSWKYNK